MNEGTAKYCVGIIKARSEINDKHFMVIAKRILKATNLLLSFDKLLEQSLDENDIETIWETDIKRATKLELAGDIAEIECNALSNDLEQLVEKHLAPSGICDVIDFWQHDIRDTEAKSLFKFASKSVYNKYSFPFSDSIQKELADMDNLYRDYSPEGGSRLALLTASKIVQQSLRKISNPTPEGKNRTKKWKRAIKGLLIYSLGIIEIVDDILEFEPYKSGISILAGIYGVDHGADLIEASLNKG